MHARILGNLESQCRAEGRKAHAVPESLQLRSRDSCIHDIAAPSLPSDELATGTP